MGKESVSPTACRPGSELVDGLCWEPCKHGFTAKWDGDESPDAKSLCIENCRDNEIENWFACEVPEKRQPMEDVRGDGVPMICGDKLDNVHGVCYLKCADGYDAFLGSCLLKDGCTLYDSEDRVFETEEQQGNKIFDIPITDVMSYSMDITINDLPVNGQLPSHVVMEKASVSHVLYCITRVARRDINMQEWRPISPTPSLYLMAMIE